MESTANARILSESETDRGWLYRIELTPCSEGAPEAAAVRIDLTFAFQDHEDIVGGGVPPSVLASSAAGVLAQEWDRFSGPDGAPSRVDLSIARRLVPEFVERVRAGLTR